MFYSQQKGRKKLWSLYRSSVKNSEIQDKGNSLEGDKPIPVVIALPNADFAKEDERDEWMIYELAFLWHEKEPLGIQAHFYAMTREIELTKSKLHQAVENGLLEARTEVLPDGITRFVTRRTLEKHIKERGLVRPEFLKRELRVK